MFASNVLKGKAQWAFEMLSPLPTVRFTEMFSEFHKWNRVLSL
jgi:hypothetical protein